MYTREENQCLINGAVKQVTRCKYGWVKHNECKLYDGPETEKKKHKSDHTKEWTT